MPLLNEFEPGWWGTAFSSYAVLHLMAFASWPWFTRLFSSMPDRGAGLVMAGGVLVYSLASQLLWRIGFFEIHFVWAVSLTIGIGISGWKFWIRPPAYSRGTRERMRKAFLSGWLVFSVLFWYWASIRSADPGVYHSEQPMDVMWMGSALASEHPPLQDAWLGGQPATYYADGQQLLAFLGLHLGLPLQKSVNITQIIWFALTGLLAFQAGKFFHEMKHKSGGFWAGLLTVLLVCFFSTPPGLEHAVHRKGWWWWWDASRVITDGEHPLITEFPFFSFWLGDNHAHLIGLPFLLLAVISGIQCWRSRKLYLLTVLLPMLCVGWSWRINPWQTPTVLAIFLLCLGVRKRKLLKADFVCLGFALLPALFLGGTNRSNGPELSVVMNQIGHTNFIEFLKVFGFLLPGVVWLYLFRPPKLAWGFLLLVAGMFACVEIIYLQDAFQNRMNTVFKVYYQLWVLLGILGSAGWVQAVRGRRWQRNLAMVFLLISVTTGVSYAGRLTIEAWTSTPKSLNAWSRLPMETQHLLQVANRLVAPGDLIAEAPGKSYNAETSLLGTWTPGSTLIGWRGHQAQWRQEYQIPPLWMLYESSSQEDLKAALKLLKVDWVVVGANEKKTFKMHPLFEEWMDDLAYRVVDNKDHQLFRLR